MKKAKTKTSLDGHDIQVLEYVFNKNQSIQFLKFFFDKFNHLRWNEYKIWENLAELALYPRGELIIEGNPKVKLLIDAPYKEWKYISHGMPSITLEIMEKEESFQCLISIIPGEASKKIEDFLDLLEKNPNFYLYPMSLLPIAKKGSKEYECAKAINITPYCDREWSSLTEDEQYSYNYSRWKSENLDEDE